MCMMVYVASDCPLPTTAWDPTQPLFHVTELTERDGPVQQRFSKPFVYYAGSHEGCGCGFQYGEYEESEEDDEESEEDAAALAAAKDSRQKLADFLALALQQQQSIEIFACWDGDQGAIVEHRGHARPVDLVRERTFFRERELLVISELAAEGHSS